MPPVHRILEVSLYSILNFIPYIILALLPFREHFRFSKSVTRTLILTVTLVQVALGLLAAFSGIDNGLLSIVSTTLYAAFYFISVKNKFGKQLFTLLILSNVANLINMSAKYLEGLLFGKALAYQSYRYSYSICMIVLHLLITLPLFFYFKKQFTKGISKGSKDPAWHYLWLIPATFYMMWFHHTYGDAHEPIEIALQPSHILFLLAVNLGALLIYHTVIQMMIARDKSIELEKKNHLLALQNLQHENLQERINEARQSKLENRHHIIVINRYLQNGEYDKIKRYLDDVERSLPDDSRIVFCQNDAINTLLLYFAQQAKSEEIDFDVVVADFPKNLTLPEADLTVLLGNLLENALEGCKCAETKFPAIRIKGKASDTSFFFHIENDYDGNTVRDASNRYMSTKHEGRGLGLASIQNIVKKHDGILEINDQNKRFAVSVFLNTP